MWRYISGDQASKEGHWVKWDAKKIDERDGVKECVFSVWSQVVRP